MSDLLQLLQLKWKPGFIFALDCLVLNQFFAEEWDFKWFPGKKQEMVLPIRWKVLETTDVFIPPIISLASQSTDFSVR